MRKINDGQHLVDDSRGMSEGEKWILWLIIGIVAFVFSCSVAWGDVCSGCKLYSKDGDDDKVLCSTCERFPHLQNTNNNSESLFKDAIVGSIRQQDGLNSAFIHSYKEIRQEIEQLKARIAELEKGRRSYTVKEFDELREACELRWDYGTTNYKRMGSGRSTLMGSGERDIGIGQLVRTSMIAGIIAADIYKEDE